MFKKLFIIFLGLIFLAGCSKPKPQVKPAEVLLAEGQSAWVKGKWNKSAEVYSKLRDYYPYHQQATLAQLRAAESLYMADDYVQAMAAFQNFEDLHPTHPDLPHVLLRIGQCHLNQTSTIDRDMTEAEAAVQAFLRLKERFPNSDEAKEADYHLKRAYRKIVEHEVYVARFYRQAKSYESAIGRYQKALAYPDVGYSPTIKAELEQVEALAAGEKPPKLKVPKPEPMSEPKPNKPWFERWWNKLRVWKRTAPAPSAPMPSGD